MSDWTVRPPSGDTWKLEGASAAVYRPVLPDAALLDHVVLDERCQNGVNTADAQPEKVAERQEWKPYLRQTARWIGVVRIDDQSPHEPVLRVEVASNES